MATVDKNFRIKNGLVVEGTTGTINGNNILTESASDSYILNLVGGSTLVKSVDTSVFNVDGSGHLTVNANTFDAYGAASSAQSAAESYADSAVSTEASNRQTAINSALTVAENYADTVSGNALNSAKSYTDSAISTEVSNRNSAISSAITTAENYADGLASNYDAVGAAAAAQTAAQMYADSAALSAENAAKSYADGLAPNYDPAGSATSAENAAKSYADSLAGNYDPAGAASTAQSNAEGYADTAASNAQANAESYADTKKTEAISAANTYTDGKVSDLVGMAPSMLDTLAKIDAAIANDANFSTTLLNDIATAQSTAESYTDSKIAQEITDRNSAIATAKSQAITTAEGYTDSAISTEVSNRNSAITTAENAAKSYADGLASNYDAAGSASSAQSAAETYADNLVANGNSSATPTYQAVKVGGYTELISGWNSTSTGATFVPVSWNSNYGTAKLTVHVRDGVHSQASEVLIARDSNNNIAITEYAIVTTNGSLADISAVYSGGIVSLTVSPTAGHTNVEAVASGSVIVWAD